MDHVNIVAAGRKLTKVECFCDHPALGESNTCPTGYGKCTECECCKVTISCQDFDFLLDVANGKIQG